MASPIVATVGGSSDNCYVTLAQADAYFALQLRGEQWANWATNRREIALIQATSAIEALGGAKLYADSPARALFPGAPYLDTQALHFPRGSDTHLVAGVTTVVIPQDVCEAVYEQAYWLLDRLDNPGLLDHQALQNAGVTSTSIDGISVSYGGKAGIPAGIAPMAWAKIKPYIRTTFGTSAGGGGGRHHHHHDHHYYPIGD